MNTLIGLSVSAALGLSLWNIFRGHFSHVYFDSAAFITAFVMLGQSMEGFVKSRVSDYISNLVSLLPRTAFIKTDQGLREAELNDIKPGDIVFVAQGARVPVDGILINPSSFDLSIISGETRAVDKLALDLVVQGAMNLGQPVEMSVTKSNKDSYFKLISDSVNQSIQLKPKSRGRIDRIALWFVPLVVLLSGFTFYYWSSRLGDEQAIAMALSVLVIACPCAIGLAVPISFLVGVLRAGRKGILIKTLDAIEKAADVDLIAFDKTGTLTKGSPKVARLKTIENISHRDILLLAASLETLSDHPYARAIRDHAKEQGVAPLNVSDSQVVSGKGIVGLVDFQGKKSKAIVGNLVWLFENGYDSTRVPADLTWEAEGSSETVLWVGVEGKILGVILLQDEIRPEAKDALRALSSYQLGMITGDSENIARSISKQLQLKFYHAGVLPEEKATIVKRLSAPKKKGMDMIEEQVAFVGDGVNDGPALATAHLGIAMGRGTSLAQETADVVLVRDDLTAIDSFFKIAKTTRVLIVQNLLISFGYNIIALPLAAGFLYHYFGSLIRPEVAAIAMVTSSLAVLLNSLRVVRK